MSAFAPFLIARGRFFMPLLWFGKAFARRIFDLSAVSHEGGVYVV